MCAKYPSEMMWVNIIGNGMNGGIGNVMYTRMRNEVESCLWFLIERGLIRIILILYIQCL